QAEEDPRHRSPYRQAQGEEGRQVDIRPATFFQLPPSFATLAWNAGSVFWRSCFGWFALDGGSGGGGMPRRVDRSGQPCLLRWPALWCVG
ncbi:unnamed protein product, partial [Ectocarpus sp. 8 AP-2014]